MVAIVAAAFPDPAAAVPVAKQLAERLGIPDRRVGLATLGEAGHPRDGQTLLAVWVPDDQVETVRALVQRHGGSVIDIRVAPAGTGMSE